MATGDNELEAIPRALVQGPARVPDDRTAEEAAGQSSPSSDQKEVYCVSSSRSIVSPSGRSERSLQASTSMTRPVRLAREPELPVVAESDDEDVSAAQFGIIDRISAY